MDDLLVYRRWCGGLSSLFSYRLSRLFHTKGQWEAKNQLLIWMKERRLGAYDL